MPDSITYPEGLTNGPYIERFGAIASVVFDHFEPKLSTYFHLEVHWTLAFEYMRATGDNVVGVRYFDQFGHTSGSVSFAKWTRNNRTGLYRIVVGACVGSPGLDELRVPEKLNGEPYVQPEWEKPLAPKMVVTEHPKTFVNEGTSYTVSDGRREFVVTQAWTTGQQNDGLKCMTCRGWCDHIDAVTAFRQTAGAR